MKEKVHLKCENCDYETFMNLGEIRMTLNEERQKQKEKGDQSETFIRCKKCGGRMKNVQTENGWQY